MNRYQSSRRMTIFLQAPVWQKGRFSKRHRSFPDLQNANWVFYKSLIANWQSVSHQQMPHWPHSMLSGKRWPPWWRHPAFPPNRWTNASNGSRYCLSWNWTLDPAQCRRLWPPRYLARCHANCHIATISGRPHSLTHSRRYGKSLWRPNPMAYRGQHQPHVPPISPERIPIGRWVCRTPRQCAQSRPLAVCTEWFRRKLAPNRRPSLCFRLEGKRPTYDHCSDAKWPTLPPWFSASTAPGWGHGQRRGSLHCGVECQQHRWRPDLRQATTRNAANRHRWWLHSCHAKPDTGPGKWHLNNLTIKLTRKPEICITFVRAGIDFVLYPLHWTL